MDAMKISLNLTNRIRYWNFLSNFKDGNILVWKDLQAAKEVLAIKDADRETYGLNLLNEGAQIEIKNVDKSKELMDYEVPDRVNVLVVDKLKQLNATSKLTEDQFNLAMALGIS